jgi:phage tail protein X
MPGLVEAIMIENRGLAEAVEIPVGTIVRMPIPENDEPRAAGRIKLW